MSRISACLRRRPHSPWLASFFTQVERARQRLIGAGRGGRLSGLLPPQALVAGFGLALFVIAGLAGRAEAGAAGRAEAGAASEAAPAATGPGSVVRET
ncbi:MAG TPA: hypothetical protein VIY07_11505, partial [Pseudolabrys sp.]